MITCQHCSVQLPEGARHCMACGRPLGALPAKSIEQLIDERARAIVAEEKEAASREEKRAGLRKAVKEARAELRDFEARWSDDSPLMTKSARRHPHALVAAILVGGAAVLNVVPHLGIFPALDWTPAVVVCPAICDGCSSSMHTLYQHWKDNDSDVISEKHLCRNPRLDVDKVGLTFDELQGATAEQVEPYLVNEWLVYLIETLVWIALALPFLPLIAAYRRARRDRQHLEVEALKAEYTAEKAQVLAAAEAELAAFEGYSALPPTREPPYR